MEIIKKTVKRAMKIGDTTPCTFRDPKTGELIHDCVHGEGNCNCFVIIPDTDAVYNFKILLKSEIRDLGLFDIVDSTYPYYPYSQNNPIGLNNLL